MAHKKSGKNVNGKKFGKDSYLADDRNYNQFANQLEKNGLEVRDITGDGNCCFRALSDQLVGNEGQHALYRRQVCQYMRQNREEFEPFVAALVDDYDDNEKVNRNKKSDSFERYIGNLEQLGTYADNGCLVAFARLYNIDIIIHQLNMPVWTIRGNQSKGLGSAKNCDRQVNLAYHNGEHYSSVRRIGDDSATPNNLNMNINHTSASSSQPKTSSNSNSNSIKNASKSNTNRLSSASSRISSKEKHFTDSTSAYRGAEASNFADAGFYASNDDPYDRRDFLDETKQLNTNESLSLNFNQKVDHIINVTECLDLNLINQELRAYPNDLPLCIESIMSKMSIDDHETNVDRDDSRSTSSKTSAKSDRKLEKKMRHMEKHRIKVHEQREKDHVAAYQSSKQTSRASLYNGEDQTRKSNSAVGSSRLANNNSNDVITSIDAKFI